MRAQLGDTYRYSGGSSCCRMKPMSTLSASCCKRLALSGSNRAGVMRRHAWSVRWRRRFARTEGAAMRKLALDAPLSCAPSTFPTVSPPAMAADTAAYRVDSPDRGSVQHRRPPGRLRRVRRRRRPLNASADQRRRGECSGKVPLGERTALGARGAGLISTTVTADRRCRAGRWRGRTGRTCRGGRGCRCPG